MTAVTLLFIISVGFAIFWVVIITTFCELGVLSQVESLLIFFTYESLKVIVVLVVLAATVHV